ncbi:POU domain, class 5, transcription factor 2 [Orcinus orca]|uniref:POU domain, class 5, transcription factor 2 n=1 Tax=Orcinus orca TaxID=9733 RepID=UPI001441F19E|nr:POU domain, class 5, transcription factor 2 [Orcinus orca]XP_049564393.1 POU domain, class 5, transcription factor 2 [Orcinus orca]
MAGHSPSNFPMPGTGGDRPAGPVPVRVDTPIELSAQAAPGRLMVRPEVRPGMCPDPEVWALSPGPPPCEFQDGMMPCRPRVGAGEVSAWFPRPSEVAFPGPCIVLQCIPTLALPEDVSAVQEMEQLAKELRQKRMTLGYSQADVALLMGALFGRTLSQTTIWCFEAQQLSLTNMWKLRLLLKMWLEQVDMENLLGLCKMETILQQAGKHRRAYRERHIGNSLEKLFLQCQKPTPQQISCIAGQLQLQKDFIQVWFHNWSKMGSRPSNDFSPLTEVGTVRPPLPRGPVCFPLTSGLHFCVPHYGGPYFTPLYPCPFHCGRNPPLCPSHHPEPPQAFQLRRLPFWGGPTRGNGSLGFT